METRFVDFLDDVAPGPDVELTWEEGNVTFANIARDINAFPTIKV